MPFRVGASASRPYSICRTRPPGAACRAQRRPSQWGGCRPGFFPAGNRYVDDKGKPLADPTQQPYGEFRMMPINLKVVIEQREIPRLLAECANSAMRIDVRRVRILVEEPPAVDLTAPEAAQPAANQAQRRPTMSRPVHGHALGGTGHGNIQDDSGAGKGESAYEEESADPVYPPVPVEVQGIIYIYNPPKVQTSGETAGDNGGQTPQVTPTSPKPAETSGHRPRSNHRR